MAKVKTYDILSPAEESAVKRAEKQEDTRSTIAKVFIFAYIFIILVLITLTAFLKLTPESAKDYLLAVGSPLGFIIGYYFKAGGKE